MTAISVDAGIDEIKKTLKRTGIQWLLDIVATSGGGGRMTMHIPDATADRLIEHGLIKMKPGQYPNCGYVHTPKGYQIAQIIKGQQQ